MAMDSILQNEAHQREALKMKLKKGAQRWGDVSLELLLTI